MIERLRTNEYLKEVMTLATGTSAAHIITILSYLVITKLYSPDSFGLFSFFTSSSVLLSIISTAAYEHAVILPARDEEGLRLVKLCGWLSLVFALLALITLGTLSTPLSDITDIPAMFWLLVPIGLFLIAQFNTLTFLFVRNGDYRNLSFGKLVQSSATAAFQIGLGFLKSIPFGLIWGFISGRFIANLFLYFKAPSEFRTLGKSKFHHLKEVASRYLDQPRFFMFSRLLIQGAIELPVLLISLLFNNTLLGFYALAFRMLSVPASFIGTSVGHVFYRRVNDDYQQSKPLMPLLVRTWGGLLALGLLPLLAVFVFGEELFSFIFGTEWATAGKVAVIMAPVTLFQFVTAPTEKVLLVLEKQRAITLFSAIDFTGRSLGILIGFLRSDFFLAVLCMILFQGLSIILLNAYLLYAVRRNDSNLKPASSS